MNLASLRPHIALWGLRGAWALAIALWAVALVPWFKTPAPSAVVASTSDRPRAAPRSTTPPLPAPPVHRAAEPSEPAAAVEPVATPAPERVAAGVCGLHDGGTAEPSPALKASYLARQASLGLQQAFDALRTRADAPSQAAAWWLRVLWAREGSADASSPACAAGADCAAPGSLPPPALAVDALVQLAQANNDPWVAQVAQRACDGVASAACSSLGTRRWSTLQPDNAAAWLDLAARDAQAVDEALFRMARASRFDGHRGQLPAQVLLATPEQAAVMQRYAAWQRADELERASDAKVAAAAARACSDVARRDANRDQLCDAAARWLTARAPASAEATTARALDCASVERTWRAAREGAQRGTRGANPPAAARS